jgi:large repetitive protein
LRTNAPFDFESKRIYNIYVQTTDGFATYTKQFVINITDSNDAPTDLALYSQVIDENQPSGTFITTIYSTDADAAGTFTYTLVNGTGGINNSSFRISNDSLYSNAIFDYESKSSYSIRIRTTDNGNLWTERAFVVTINNTNDAPTDIALSTTEFAENRLNRSLVATLSTTDADANSFTYSLVSGAGSADNNSFVISGNQLRSNKVFNYEAQASYNIRIQTNDGNSGTFEKAFTITITDSNDAPSDIVLSTTTVVENAPVGTKVCTISTIDQDAGDGFNYSFVNVPGNNNSNFIIVADELRTNAIFDYETRNFYLVMLQTTDAAGASYTRQFVINIKDTNDMPLAMELDNNTVDENQPAGTFVGLLSATDPDQAESFGYMLVGGTGASDNGSFRISNDSLLTDAVFNYESKKVYQVRIRVNDREHGKFEKQFIININDVNDAPTALSISMLDLDENAPLNTPVGTFATADADANDAHTYTLVAGAGSTDNALFLVSGSQLVSNTVADFEVKTSYSIRVRSTDAAGETIENTFTVSVVDVSEKPTINDQNFNVSENAVPGTEVGTLVSASPDAGAVLKYSFAGNAAAPFSIDENTGLITVSGKLDYEKQSLYTFKILVTDDQVIPLFDTASLTIKVNDEIEIKQSLPANNYMSPNNDGLNDLFVIENVSLYADYSLTIYNESGLEIYKIAGNYQNNWDGTYNGNTLPTGVYFYVFRNSKTGDEFKGALNIIK